MHPFLNDKTQRAILTGILVSMTALPILTVVCEAYSNQHSPIRSIANEQTTTEAEILLPDKAIRREISRGQRQIFQIALPKGIFLSLRVSAQNAELALTFFGPELQRLHEVNNRRFGPTPLSFISNASGIHTLEVQSLEGEEKKATYELCIAQLRDAVAQDAIVVSAEKLLSEAESLRKEWKLESFHQSIDKYEEARRAFGNLNNHREEAYTLNNIGEVHATLGRNPKALEYYIRAIQLSESAADRLLEIEILNNLSDIYIDSGEKEKVLEYGEKARTLSKQLEYVRGEARAVNNLGELFSYILGEKEKAIDIFDEALGLWRTTADSRGQAETMSNLGYTHTDMGNVKKALSYFNEALLFWRAVKDRKGEALTLTAIGLAHSALSEMQEAIENHDKAMHLFQMIGDRIGVAITLNGMAYVYYDLGEKRKALELYDRSLELYRTAGRRSGEAVTMGLIGEIYESLGEKEKALDYYNRKLEIARSIENRRLEAYTLAGIGTVTDSLGYKDKALDHYKKALALSESLSDPRCQAYCLNSIGYAYDRQGQKRRAISLYEQALHLLRSSEDKAGETLTLHRIARASLDLGDLAGAYDHCKKLLSIIESRRVKVTNQDLRASYFASAHNHYELYIDLLMGMHKQHPNAGYDAAALGISEKARGRSLLDLLNEARADIRQGVDPVLLRKERDLQQLLNSKAEHQVRLLSREHKQEKAAAIKKEIAALASDYEGVLAEIRDGSPRYAALTQPSTLNLRQIQEKVLDENSMLLEYSLGDERSYLWAVTSDSLTTVELPGRAAVESAAERLYESLISYTQTPKGQSMRQARRFQSKVESDFSETAAYLSRMLLQPIAALLGKKRLVIVADGALQYVPFVALPEPAVSEQDNEKGKPLVVNHEIVSLPSASMLAVLRKELDGRDPAPKTLAVLADPVFEKDDPRVHIKTAETKGGSPGDSDQKLMRSPGLIENRDEIPRFHRLPAAGLEATAIISVVPPQERKLALGFDASVSTATSEELRQFKILHFATHALIYGAHPQLYGIVLSLVDPQGNTQNGFLRLNEIYNLKLSAETVVLSACQTAIGKEIKGEGLVGLTRGFMYAGASRVVASLWQINDRASAELMKRFYEAMFGPQRLRPAAALQAAQIAMSKHPRWNFPYYWAAFTLQGEWR